MRTNAFLVGWLVAVGVTSIVAGSNPAFIRSGSVRDVILLTPLDRWELVRTGYQGIAAPFQMIRNFGLFILLLRLVFDPLTTLLCAAIAILFLLLAMLAGSLVCLTARSRAEATFCSVAFPLTMTAGAPLVQWLFPAMADDAVFVVTTAAPPLLVPLWIAYTRDATAIRTIALFLVIHLSLLVCFVLAPSVLWNDPVWSASLINPLFWLQASVAEYRPLQGDGWPPLLASGEGLPQLLCYVSAVASNVAIVVWWLFHDFDRLVDRPHRTPGNPGPPLTAITKETLR